MKKRFYQLIASLLCTALVWTGSDAAQTLGVLSASFAIPVNLPRVIRPSSDPSYFTQQAIVQHLASQVQAEPEYVRASLGYRYHLHFPENPQSAAKGEVIAFSHVLNPIGWISWIFQLGNLGFSLFHEYSHLIVALVVSPKIWRSVLTPENARGNRTWNDWRTDLFLSRLEGRPEVHLPVEKGWRDHAIRMGGWALSVAIPVAALSQLDMGPLAPFTAGIFILLGSGMLNAIARSFYSDFLEIIEPGVYACGGTAIVGRGGVDEFLDRMQSSVSKLVRRGVQSMGIDFLVEDEIQVPKDVVVAGTRLTEDKVKVHVWVSVLSGSDGKKWFFKRDKHAKEFFDEFKGTHASLLKKLRTMGDKIYVMIGHTRWATTGNNSENPESIVELTDAAQPQKWIDGYMAPKWGRMPNGTLGWTYKNVDHRFLFNGDLDFMKRLLLRVRQLLMPSSFKLHEGRKLDNAQLRTLLGRVFEVDPETIPSGDTATMAGLLHLFYTQGRFLESLRYAYVVHLAKDENGPFPTRAKLKEQADFFHHAFDAFRVIRERSGHPLPATLEDASDSDVLDWIRYLKTLIPPDGGSTQARENFLREHIQDESLRQQMRGVTDDISHLGSEAMETLLLNTSYAFFRNTMDYAVLHEIKPRYEGSIAGIFSSSLNAEGRVMTVEWALGQGFVDYYDVKGRFTASASDRKVLQNGGLLKGARIARDDGIGEVRVTGMTNEGANSRVRVTYYVGPHNRVLTADELRERSIYMDDPRVDVTPPVDPLFAKHPLEAEAKRLVAVVTEVHKDGKAMREGQKSDNLQPGSEFTRLLLKKQIDEDIRRNVFQRGIHLPKEIDNWVWEEADVLSRRRWLREESFGEKELGEAVGAASKELETKLARLAIPKEDHELQSFLDHVTLILRSSSESFDKALQIVQAVFALLRHKPLLAREGRLNEDYYDLIMVGTEKGDFAGKFFGKTMDKMLNQRTLYISANDYLEIADRFVEQHLDDIKKGNFEGFYRALKMDPKRTIFFITSQAAENFGPDLAKKFEARVGFEMFGVTGGRDNRLRDVLGENRLFDFKDPVSMDEAHLADYSASIMFYNELFLFTAKNLADLNRGKTFFGSPVRYEHFAPLEPKLDALINESMPDIMGYTSTGAPLGPSSDAKKPKDYQNLKSQGEFLASFVTEAPLTWRLRAAFILLTVGILHSGISGWVVSLILGHALTGVSLWATGFVDALIYIGLVGISHLGRRYLLLLFGKATPGPLFGIGGKKIVFADTSEMITDFIPVMARDAEGNAFGINSFTVEGVSINNAPHVRAGNTDRRTLWAIGRPDARLPLEEQRGNAAVLLGKQIMSILSFPLYFFKYIPLSIQRKLNTPIKWLKLVPQSSYVFTYGTNNPPNLGGELKARHRHIAVGASLALPANSPTWVQDFWAENVDAFKRLLAAGRVVTSLCETIANTPPGFVPGTTHNNVDSTTTATPWPGERLIPVIAEMPLMLEEIEDTRPQPEPRANAFAVDEQPVLSWQKDDWAGEHEGKIEVVARRRRAPTANPRSWYQSPVAPRHQPQQTPAAPIPVFDGLGAAKIASNGTPHSEVFDDLFEQVTNRNTSLIRSADIVSPGSPRSVGRVFSRHDAQPAGMDAETFLGLQMLFASIFPKNTDIPEGCAVTVVEVFNKIADFGHTTKDRPEQKGLFIFDRRLLVDVAHGVEGALENAQLEMTGELQHYKQWKNDAESDDRFEREYSADLEKIKYYARFGKLDRKHIRSYLKSTENPWDVLITHDEGDDSETLLHYEHEIYRHVDAWMDRNGLDTLPRDSKDLHDDLLIKISPFLEEYVRQVLRADQEAANRKSTTPSTPPSVGTPAAPIAVAAEASRPPVETTTTGRGLKIRIPWPRNFGRSGKALFSQLNKVATSEILFVLSIAGMVIVATINLVSIPFWVSAFVVIGIPVLMIVAFLTRKQWPARLPSLSSTVIAWPMGRYLKPFVTTSIVLAAALLLAGDSAHRLNNNQDIPSHLRARTESSSSWSDRVPFWVKNFFNPPLSLWSPVVPYPHGSAEDINHLQGPLTKPDAPAPASTERPIPDAAPASIPEISPHETASIPTKSLAIPAPSQGPAPVPRRTPNPASSASGDNVTATLQVLMTIHASVLSQSQANQELSEAQKKALETLANEIVALKAAVEAYELQVQIGLGSDQALGTARNAIQGVRSASAGLSTVLGADAKSLATQRQIESALAALLLEIPSLHASINSVHTHGLFNFALGIFLIPLGARPRRRQPGLLGAA